MSRLEISLSVVVLLAVLAVAGLLRSTEQAHAQLEKAAVLATVTLKTVDTVRVHDSISVVKRVTLTQTLRDTLLQHLTDTLKVIEYIRQTDTLRQNCLACVASAARVKLAADSAVALWKAAYEAVKPTWKDRIGVTVGYGAVLSGGQVRVGPSLGVSVKVWP